MNFGFLDREKNLEQNWESLHPANCFLCSSSLFNVSYKNAGNKRVSHFSYFGANLPIQK